MDKQELGEIILGIKKSPTCKSTLQLALQAAHSHLRIDNGTPTPEAFKDYQFEKFLHSDDSHVIVSEESDMFCALLLYLISIEQLGSIFFSGGIDSVIIKYFGSTLSKNQVDAIRKLRHALAHSFGLINADHGIIPKQKYTIVFYDENKKIIELPPNSCSYKGYEDKNEESSIRVYAFSLIQMIDRIIRMITEDFKHGLISIQDPKMVQARYTILV